MKRREVLLLLVLTGACGRSGTAPAGSLPTQIGGEWRLAGSDRPPDSSAPEMVRSLGMKRMLRGNYVAGPVKVVVTLCEMNGTSSSFELMQKWPPAAGSVAFYKDQWFGLAESPGTDHALLNSFVAAFEKSFH